MEFKIYSGGDGVPGGGDETLLWTESHLRNNSQGVTITDGIFQVNLGAITTLPGSVDFNNSTLWLSINLGSTNATCTPFSSCTPDGEMNPMVRFTASPYSLNTDLLDGIDSTGFVQLAQGLQVDASVTNASIAINKTGGTANIIDLQRSGASVFLINNTGELTYKPQTDDTDALRIQNAAGTTTLVNVDTTANIITANVDMNLTLAGTENLAVTTTTGTNSVDLVALTVTNDDGGANIQRGIVVTNADDVANATTEALISLVNAEGNASTVTDGLVISGTAGGGTDTIVDAIDVSDDNITNAINIGTNFLVASSDSINDFSGIGLAVASNALTIQLLDASDGSGVASSRSGLEFGDTGSNELTLLQGCGDGQILKWDDATDVRWECANDNDTFGAPRLDQILAATTGSGVEDNNTNTIEWNWDFTTAAVDSGLIISESTASTTGTQDQQALLELITLASSTASPLQVTAGGADVGDVWFDLTGAADFEIRDGGAAVLGITDTGAVTITTTTSAGLTLDTGTTGAIAIGTNANAKTLTFGNVSGATALNFDAGTGAFDFDSTVTNTALLNVGAPSAVTAANGLTGLAIDLQANYTSDNADTTGASILLDALNDTDATADDFTGLSVTGGGVTANNASAAPRWEGLEVILPDATNTNSIAAGLVIQGFDVETPADTLSTAETTTYIGYGISTVGALTHNTAAGTLNWRGLDFTTPASTVNIAGGNVNIDGARIAVDNITQTAGTVTANGLHVDLSSADITTGGTVRGIQIDGLSSETVGTIVGLNIGTITAGAATETGISIGNGWDTGISVGTGVTTAFTAASGNIVTSNEGVEFAESDTNPTCAAGDYSLYADTSEARIKKCVNGVATDIAEEPDVIYASDATVTAWADNDTTALWNGALPSITPTSTAQEVLVMVSVATRSSNAGGTTDVYLGARVDRETTTASCDDVNTVGATFGLAQNDTNTLDLRDTMTNVFVDSPASTSAQSYIVCTSVDSGGTVGGADEVRTDMTLMLVQDAGDLAEVYSTNDGSLGAADVVVLDPTLKSGVRKSTTPYEKGLAGAVATNPAMVIGNKGAEGVNGVPVALSGRVPVKVSTENGVIKPGDALTSSSTPGVAMKATKAGVIIGVAMAGYERDGIGSVLTFVKAGSYTGSNLKDILEGSIGDPAALNGENIGLTALAYFLDQEASANTINASEIIADRVVAGLEVVTPQVTADRVKANMITPSTSGNLGIDIDSSGQLFIEGEDDRRVISFDSQGNADFAGGLTVGGGLEVSGVAQFNGESFFDKLVTFSDDVIFKGTPTFNNNTGGYALIRTGAQEIEVKFPKAYKDAVPIVAVNIKNGQFAPFAYKDLTKNGFKIVLDKPATTELEFAWTALQIKDPETTQTPPTPQAL